MFREYILEGIDIIVYYMIENKNNRIISKQITDKKTNKIIENDKSASVFEVVFYMDVDEKNTEHDILDYEILDLVAIKNGIFKD